MFDNSPNTDGVVINTTSFGRTGNVKAPFDKGRTTTHEVGHWLNLFHIWGDRQGCNNGSDFCDDTPDQHSPNYNCSQIHASCSTTGDMYMNYLDYTDDACMNLFTLDQKTRIKSLFESGGIRESIKVSGQLMFAEISGPTTICGRATYTIENLPPDTPLAWSVSSDIRVISEQDTSITVERDPTLLYMYPTSYILVDIGEPINMTLEHNLIVWKGGINETTDLIDISSSLDEYGNPYIHTAQLKGDMLYSELKESPRWSVSEGLNLTFTDGTIMQFEGYLSQGKYIVVELINPCDEATQIVHRFNNNMSGYSSFTLSPNPATDIVTVQLNEDSSESGTFSTQNVNKAASSGVIEIQLWSATSLLKTYKTDQSSTFQIPVSNLVRGMYFVRVIKDGKTYMQKLLKN